jgi:hypothetical protein
METVEKAAIEYAIKTGNHNDAKAFKAGVEYAQRWISVDEELPDIIKLRSAILVKCRGEYRYHVCYETIEASVPEEGTVKKFFRFLDEDTDIKLNNVEYWRPIELIK